MSTPPTFRFPFALSGQPKEVQQAHVFAFNAILDLQEANKALTAKVSTATAPSTASTTASTTTNVTNTSETIIEGTAGNNGTVNNQTGNAAYTTLQSDNGALIVLDDPSHVALTLTSAVTIPYFFFVTNLGAGTATLTPTSGMINGAGTLPIDNTAIVAYDGSNWWATELPIVPQNTPSVAHEWLASYNSATGVFTLAQPSFADISGTPSTVQVPFQSLTTTGSGAATLAAGVLNVPTPPAPATGFSGTITTAKLTVGGTNGSMSFTAGVLTSQIAAT